MAILLSNVSKVIIKIIFSMNKISKLCLVVTLIITTYQLNLHIHPVTSKLQDQSGRIRVFHGINVVYKQFPFLPSRTQFNPNSSLVQQDFLNLKSWGLNSIRLFISWQGFQPVEEELKKIIREAAQYNVTVLIDAHQDLYSKKYCGQGFPLWVSMVGNFPFPLKVKLTYDKQGFPTKQSCMQIPFSTYYATEDVMKFSNQFFTNKNGILDKFIKMWEKVAAYFFSEDNVIGYDLINQPSGGNIYKGPYEFIAPGMNNNKFLLPFYKKVAKAIRKIDSTKLIFFEPSPADQIGGFYDSPSQQPFKQLDVMSYHTYCPLGKSLGTQKCHLLNSNNILLRQKNAQKLHIGAVMTQFGSVFNSSQQLSQLHSVLHLSESTQTSWYYWQFKYNCDSTSITKPVWGQSFYDSNGQLQYQKVKILAHPYAYAICGNNIQQSYKDGFYQLQLVPKLCGNLVTEIFINQDMYFNKGWEVEFIPTCDQCQIKGKTDSRNHFQVYFHDSVLYKPIRIRIVGHIN